MPTPTDRAPRVSIITPVYNAEKFIETCIASVLAQTFTDWEQIVVDDGSTDTTAGKVRAFNDPRIRYIQLPHRGLAALAATYNTGLQAARGELVAILEGDDAWTPRKLESQVRTFGDPAVVLSWGPALVIDDDGRVVRPWLVARAFRRDLGMPELFRVLARWNVLTPSLTVVVRKSALEKIHGFQQMGSSLFVDLPTWLLLSAEVTGRAAYVSEDLGRYRIHSTNTGTVQNSQMRIEHHEVFAEVKRRLTAERLGQLGWTLEDERATLASASLTRGIAYLQDGDRARARTAFRSALRLTRSTRERATALVGYASALSGLNLIKGLQRVLALAAANPFA